jgi:uncharacterized protein
VNRPELRTSPVSEPFWEATRRHQLVLQWCAACDRPIHYPREICPRCFGTELDWRPASGDAVVYAATAMDDHVVALVDLAEGARMMTNVIGCDPSEVVVGLRVRVTWEDLEDGRALPLFEPSR